MSGSHARAISGTSCAAIAAFDRARVSRISRSSSEGCACSGFNAHSALTNPNIAARRWMRMRHDQRSSPGVSICSSSRSLPSCSSPRFSNGRRWCGPSVVALTRASVMCLGPGDAWGQTPKSSHRGMAVAAARPLAHSYAAITLSPDSAGYFADRVGVQREAPSDLRLRIAVRDLRA